MSQSDILVNSDNVELRRKRKTSKLGSLPPVARCFKLAYPNAVLSNNCVYSLEQNAFAVLCRTKLCELLQWSNHYLVHRVLVKIEDSPLYSEQAILYSKVLPVLFFAEIYCFFYIIILEIKKPYCQLLHFAIFI